VAYWPSARESAPGSLLSDQRNASDGCICGEYAHQLLISCGSQGNGFRGLRAGAGSGRRCVHNRCGATLRGSVRWAMALALITLAMSGCAPHIAQRGPAMSTSGARSDQRFSVMRSVSQVASDMTVRAGASVPVMVAARGGIPAAGVSVVAVHVSVRVASGHRSGISPGGTVQIAPWAPTVPGRSEKTSGRGAPGLPGTPQSSAAHLVAYHGGGTTDGFALVGLGAGGALMVSNQGSTPVAVSMDVEGYATGSGSAARDGVVVPLTSPEVVTPKGEMCGPTVIARRAWPMPPTRGRLSTDTA